MSIENKVSKFESLPVRLAARSIIPGYVTADTYWNAIEFGMERPKDVLGAMVSIELASVLAAGVAGQHAMQGQTTAAAYWGLAAGFARSVGVAVSLISDYAVKAQQQGNNNLTKSL